MYRTQVIASAIFGLFFCSNTQSADLKAKLNTQIELLPSCVINDQYYTDGTTGIKFGELNFGTVSGTYKGTLDTALSNGMNSSIKIECNGSSIINVTFGAGKNDTQVPQNASANYYRALSNGKSYVAYNLLYGSDKKIMKPLDLISLKSNGQPIYIELFGRAVLKDQNITSGAYSDIIPITIEF